MPRALILAAALLSLLAACSPYPRPAASISSPEATMARVSEVEQWLSLESAVAKMDREQIVARLVRIDRPQDIEQLYYYGLLNHHLDTYGAWTLARDTFRQVLEFEQLSEAQRQLVTVLEAYDQSRINAYLKQQELVRHNSSLRLDLETAELERVELEQKLHALTELETDISSRKGQD